MPIEQPRMPKLRWFNLTPGRLLIILLAVEGALLLSEWWFPKGWAVLIAVAAVGLFLLLTPFWFIFALIFHCRFQFSIRSLLLLTVAVAIPFSWLAVEIKWTREQKEAVEALMKMGGSVYYDYEIDVFSYQTIRGAHPPGPAWLRAVIGDDFLINPVYVGLPQKVSDVDLKHLEGMKQLRILDLSNTRITDTGLEHLKELTQLRWLDLGHTKVSNEGVKRLLHELPKCRMF